MDKTIALIFSSYGPYHLARLKAAAKKCSNTNFKIVGIELARQQNEYPWKINIDDLNISIISVIDNQPLEEIKTYKLIQKLTIVLDKIKPDILFIPGYFRVDLIFLIFWCIWHKKHPILMSESKGDDAVRYWWVEKIKSWIIKLYHAALVGGIVHQEYLLKLGMKSESIFLGYDVVDNQTFQSESIKLLPAPINKPYFLTINRFVPKKNLFFLIECYSLYCRIVGSKAWNLILCGDGELYSQIKQKIIDLELEDYVYMPGFLQQDQLLPYFAHAKCFIHASIQEQWGLVVNEAMAARLPILVSNRCGCFKDLVMEGVNGFGFDPENQEQLTQLMVKISSSEVELEKMGQASLEHIQKYSPDYFGQGLMSAIEYALNKR